MVDCIGIEYELTHDLIAFKTSDTIKINYSDELIDNCISIKPHVILFEYGLKEYHIEVIADKQFEKVILKNSVNEVSFDLFGASFWFLSRYEEYLAHKSDEYARFHYKSSLAYQYDFINIPLVNLWISELKKIILKKYPKVIFKVREYNFISTIDVDTAYKYKLKGFIRSIAGILSERSFSKTKLRLQILLNKKVDPFDCYDFLIEAHKKFKVDVIYFLLMGDYGPNDKNISATNLKFQALIKHLADYSEIGIHPSFNSALNIRQLIIEVNRLKNISHKSVTKSRQHFSLLKFPETYQNLDQAVILQDYSMGYTNFNGFRASYCFPYKWYNLKEEMASLLQINPFCISEHALFLKNNKNIKLLSKEIIDEVKKYNGQLISIFHNESFNEQLKKFYIEFLDLAR